MTSWGKVRTVLAGFCASVLIQAAVAHDFGGDSAGDPPPEPPEPPPCARSPDPCCDSSDSSVGDPIRTFDGGFYLADTDLQVGVNYPIRLLRRFDGRSQFDNALGYGWAFDHDRRLFEYPDGSVLLRSGCGRRDTFVFTGGAYVTPRDAPQAPWRSTATAATPLLMLAASATSSTPMDVWWRLLINRARATACTMTSAGACR